MMRGGPLGYRQQPGHVNGINTVTTKFSSLSDPISPIAIHSRHMTNNGLQPAGSFLHN